jgi:hypothetical protein
VITNLHRNVPQVPLDQGQRDVLQATLSIQTSTIRR